MTVLRTLVMIFAMFSRIPMPKVAWLPANLRYVPGGLPLVGLAIGVMQGLWIWMGHVTQMGPLLYSAGLTLIPIFVSGGIHLDGWCDTCDAMASHASPERKQEILKDPHAGAFAVIGLACYLLAYVALAAELPVQLSTIWLIIMLHVLSRMATSLSIIVFPANRSTGLFAAFQQSAARTQAGAILAVWLVLYTAAALLVSWTAGLAMLMAASGILLYVSNLSRKQFGGMSGDLAGYLLQLSELAMLAVIVVITRGGWL